jgi:hypothetical protein
VPAAPTLKHVVVLGHDTAASVFVVGEVCVDHVEPPLAVVMIVPVAPTA